MQSYFALETEAEFRRHEWERAIAAKAQSDLVCPRDDRTRRLQTARALFARLSAILAELLPSPSWQTASCRRS